MYNRTSTYYMNVRLSAIASQSQLTFLLKNPTDKYRRAAASAQNGMHRMSPSSLSPFGNRLLQTVLLGFITHLDFFVCPNGFGEYLFSNVYSIWDV